MGRAGKQPFVKAGEKSRAHRGRPAASHEALAEAKRAHARRDPRASLGPRPAPGRPGGEGKPSAPAGSSRAEREPHRALPRGLALGRGGRRGRVRERGPPGPLLGPPSPPLASALVERVEAAAEGRPGRGSPGGRARSKQPRGPESRGAAAWVPSPGVPPGVPPRASPAAILWRGRHFARRGGGGARVPAPGGRAAASPLFLACGSPARTPRSRARGSPSVHERPSPCPPFASGRALRTLAHGARGKRFTRGAWNRAVGSCVWSSPSPEGAARGEAERPRGPWALGRGSPELGRFKKKKI